MKVIYPGSFNPWTFGHQSIYERACLMFGEVTIVVASNPSKSIDPEFIKWTLELLDYPVEICTDLVATKADVIIRGVRSGDWEYEQNLAQWNKELGAETVFLCPSPELSHISSSAVRELIKYEQPVYKFMARAVFDRWNGPNEFQCKGCRVFNDKNTDIKCNTYKNMGACRKRIK